MSSPRTIEELKAKMREELLSDPDINASNAEAWINSQNLPQLLKEIQQNNSSVNSNVPMTPPAIRIPNVTMNSNVPMTPRLPNGSINYNAMAKQWKANVRSGKINVTAKSKNNRSLAQQVSNLTQNNRNKMERNKKALTRAIMRNSSIGNKNSFASPLYAPIPKNMMNKIREQNALNANRKRAEAKQKALNALRGKKGPTATKSRKNRKNRK